MLESLDRLNIGNLNLEEPVVSERLPFDVDRDISDAAWNIIISELARSFNRRDPGLSDFWDQAYLKLASPKRYKPVLRNEEFAAILPGDLTRDPYFYHFRAAVKILYPEIREELLFPGVSKGAINIVEPGVIKMILDGFRKDPDNDWERFLQTASSGNILFPNSYFDTDQDWEKVRDLAMVGHSVRLGFLFDAKVAFPKQTEEFNVEEVWKILREKVDLTKSGWNEDTMTYALDFKALLCDEIRVTETGIEFIPKQKPLSLTKDTPPIPEVRKF
ncbi:MAG: hypothetical protein Q7R49_01765 [Candidatus Daviesbacteria bacterium]|nr:hypothetical protein [Candidatus Daviesbacteria bacterium]